MISPIVVKNRLCYRDAATSQFQAGIKKYQPDIFQNQADIIQKDQKVFGGLGN